MQGFLTQRCGKLPIHANNSVKRLEWQNSHVIAKILYAAYRVEFPHIGWGVALQEGPREKLVALVRLRENNTLAWEGLGAEGKLFTVLIGVHTHTHLILFVMSPWGKFVHPWDCPLKCLAVNCLIPSTPCCSTLLQVDGKEHAFTFDRVYAPGCSQEEVGTGLCQTPTAQQFHNFRVSTAQKWYFPALNDL